MSKTNKETNKDKKPKPPENPPVVVVPEEAVDNKAALKSIKQNLKEIAPGNREADLAILDAVKLIDQAIGLVKFIDKALSEK